MQVAYLSGSTRLILVIGMILFICFHIRRSFENREDTRVIDEPFYAYYLKKTGLKHPMFDEIIQTDGLNAQQVLDKAKSIEIWENILLSVK